MRKGGNVERQKKNRKRLTERECVCERERETYRQEGEANKKKVYVQHKSPCSQVYIEKPNRT